MATQSYSEIKNTQLLGAMTVRIFGKQLEHSFNSINERKSLIPIIPCFCVQDSPDNPCTCGKDLIIWIPNDQILFSGKHTSSATENSFQFFDVNKDADLLFEEVSSYKATDYYNYKKNKRSSFVFDVLLRDKGLLDKLLDILNTPPTIPVPDDDKPGVANFISTLKKLVQAFSAGYTVGKAIDEKTGLSDKIADLLCELDPDCEN